ncbi:MAG: BolA family protein [Robiginitomaculum sp.]|nr:BolA family protein [Robiginitomaculum sp.]MDQ7076581.1 BolA family protein [Robiginitomaculum sp.]
MSAMAAAIETKLRKAFAPQSLIVRDVSHQHAGHAGARPGGQTHFEVEITSSAFNGLSRLAMHRAVMGQLDEEFAGSLHALNIKAKGVTED